MISPLRRSALLAGLALFLAAAGPRNAAVFDRAWGLVAARYWDPAMHGVDWNAMRDRYRTKAIAAPDTLALYAVLDEMLGALDDGHVYAITPSERRAVRQGDSAGLGFSASQADDGVWRIDTINAGGPAAEAGVQVGWQLLSMAGQPINTHYHPAANEKVPLVVRDDSGVIHSLTLQTANLDDDIGAYAVWLPGTVLLLRLPGFDGGADRWVIRQLAASPAPRAVILDLRENGGGRSDVLDRIAGAFFQHDRPVLRSVQRRVHDEMTKGAGPASYQGPLVVMVGPRSASASEAFAALIEESGRGITVGERTAGSLEDGVHYRLPDGGELSVAEFDIRTPAGHRLEGAGFTPRHVVKPSLMQRRAGEDPVLAFAQNLLLARPR